MFRGKRPVVVISYCKYTTIILTTKEIIFYFAFLMQKCFFWLPAKLFLANFRFKRLSLPWWVLYPLKQNNRNTGRKTGKYKKGSDYHNPNPFTTYIMNKKVIFLWLQTQPPIFLLPGSYLQRQFPGSLLYWFSKGTPKNVCIGRFPLSIDYPGLYAFR